MAAAFKHIDDFLDLSDLDHHGDPIAKSVYDKYGVRQLPKSGNEILEESQKAGAANDKVLCEALNNEHTNLLTKWAEGGLKTGYSADYAAPTQGYRELSAPRGRTTAFDVARSAAPALN